MMTADSEDQPIINSILLAATGLDEIPARRVNVLMRWLRRFSRA